MRVIKLNFIYIIVLLFFAVGFFTHCANPAAPQGGPKDTLPPKIVEITPQILTKNFAAEEIEIVFNEYIQLTNPQTEVIISPEMERKPMITVKGRSVVIDLKDIKLDSATTYKVDFGMAIKDNNEGNPLTNFAYVFSTGDEIDSLAMSGQVIDAFTGDSIFNALVLLYDASKDSTEMDSVLFLSKPNSVTRTDSMGVFLATNLKGIDYRVYAISEETTDARYNNGTDKVAFVDSLLNPAKMEEFSVWYNPKKKVIEATPQVIYRLFSEPEPLKRQNMKKSSRITKNVVLLEFAEKNPIIKELKLDSISIDDVVIDYSKYKDSVTIYYPYMENFPDSLKGSISYHSTTPDSLAKDTIIEKEFALGFREVKSKKRDSDVKVPNPFVMASESPQILNPYQDIVFSFGMPLKMVDSTRISLVKLVQEEQEEERGTARRGREVAQSENQNKQSETIEEPVEFKFVRDSLKLLKWRLKADWEDGVQYKLFIPDSVFVNVYNQKNDTLKANFEVMNQENYGLINMKINSSKSDSIQYIVVFMEGDNEAYKKIIKSDTKELEFEYIKPGDYTIMIIEDKNNDGKWSDGVLTKRIQPERVAFYSDNLGKREVKVKENWEIEGVELNLDKLFQEEDN